MYAYPIVLTPDDNGTVLVQFPDIPFAHTFGEDEAEAVARATEALESAVIALIGDREDIPRPSKPTRKQRTVALPALSAAKVALYEAMRERGVTKSELARRLRFHVTQVQRLLDLRHVSRLDQIEAALAILGKRLSIEIKNAA
jgi:antitoxin HicB